MLCRQLVVSSDRQILEFILDPKFFSIIFGSSFYALTKYTIKMALTENSHNKAIPIRLLARIITDYLGKREKEKG